MKITEVLRGESKCLTPDSQYLDASNAVEFKKIIHAQLSGASHFIIDLQNINFMDSTGLGALVSCLRKVDEAHGRLTLSAMQPTVRTLFELVRLYKVFEITTTLEEALQSKS